MKEFRSKFDDFSVIDFSCINLLNNEVARLCFFSRPFDIHEGVCGLVLLHSEQVEDGSIKVAVEVWVVWPEELNHSHSKEPEEEPVS